MNIHIYSADMHIYILLLSLFHNYTAGLEVWHQGQRVRSESSWARTAGEGVKLAAVALEARIANAKNEPIGYNIGFIQESFGCG